MSDVDAMMTHLRTHLDDWDSWRVFGDWLTDQGDARGTLVGLAYRIATGHTSVDERRAMVVERERFEQEHADTWLSGYSALPGTAFSWRNGFITGVKLPWTEETPQKLSELLAHPTACLLTATFLSGNNIGDEGLRAIAALENIRLLHVLHLGYNRIGDDGVRALVASEGCAWTELYFHNNEIGSDGAHAIATSERCRALRRLDLGFNRIGTEGALSIARSVHMSALRMLSIEGNRIDAAGKAALADSETLKGCTIRT